MNQQADFLKNELEKQTARHESERNRLRLATVAIRLTAISLSAAITIALGVKGYFLNYELTDITISIFALCASALLTALTAWESFSDHAGRWVRRKTLLGTIWEIRHDLEFHMSTEDGVSEQTLEELYTRLQRCFEQENREWLSSRKKNITQSLTGHQKL